MLPLLLVIVLIACGSSNKLSIQESINNDQNAALETTSTDSEEITKPEQDNIDQARIDSLTKIYKDQIYNQEQNKANRITTFYILAQQKFYSAEYEEALFLINQASAVKETPDVLALKGSIYFGLGSTENFVTFWKRALDMDKNVPIPPSPVIIEELKKQGLINDNPDRNFK